jgi:hypothetical protein
MTTNVECYAGASYPEKPRSFDWQGQQYNVVEILSQYRQPGSMAFCVRCTPGDSTFSLTYKIPEDEWQIQPKSSVMISEQLQ